MLDLEPKSLSEMSYREILPYSIRHSGVLLAAHYRTRPPWTLEVSHRLYKLGVRDGKVLVPALRSAGEACGRGAHGVPGRCVENGDERLAWHGAERRWWRRSERMLY